MAEQKVKGVCRICEKEYASSSLQRHIKSHLSKAATATSKKNTHFLVRAVVGPYFMYFLVPLKSHFYDLDRVLRNYWMECCGHMSSFMVDREEIDMNLKINKVFYAGFKCEYIYDWGSSTYVSIEVKDAYVLSKTPKGISIIARNNPLDLKCGKCEKKQAVILIPEEYYQGKNPFYCEDCHEENDDEYYHSVTNSPRMGVCGYDGETDDDDGAKVMIE